MNQEKISELIKKIRKTNNLTQKDFAQLFGVTYQAVSKWENGKNMPDIEILKKITEYYSLDINHFLDGTESPKKKKVSWIYIVGPLILLFILLGLLYFKNKSSFEFKTLTTSCSNFTISGSIAYNNQKSSIYISHINYCGGNDLTKYKTISCSLYETHDNLKKEIEHIEKNTPMTLEEFLKDLTFYIDNYKCDMISSHTFHLEIDATNETDEITSYKIPLNLTTCQAQP